MRIPFVISAFLGLTVAKDDFQACMYCKRSDTNSGYMTSFSYCGDAQDQRCIQNFEDYINPELQCVGKIQEGWLLDIDVDCKAQNAAPGLCPGDFIASRTQYGTSLPYRTVLLGENTKCTMMIDATNAVARVTFSGTNSLGVLYPGYVMGEPITIKRGDIKYITVYNGSQKGSVQFTVTFAGAATLATSLATLATLALY